MQLRDSTASPLLGLWQNLSQPKRGNQEPLMTSGIWLPLGLTYQPASFARFCNSFCIPPHREVCLSLKWHWQLRPGDGSALDCVARACLFTIYPYMGFVFCVVCVRAVLPFSTSSRRSHQSSSALSHLLKLSGDCYEELLALACVTWALASFLTLLPSRGQGRPHLSKRLAGGQTPKHRRIACKGDGRPKCRLIYRPALSHGLQYILYGVRSLQGAAQRQRAADKIL